MWSVKGLLSPVALDPEVIGAAMGSDGPGLLGLTAARRLAMVEGSVTVKMGFGGRAAGRDAGGERGSKVCADALPP